MVIAVAFLSCSNEEETFSFDDDGVPVATAQQRISEEQFNAMVNGAGWVETNTHEIYSSGDFDKRDYWDGMEGVAGPSRYSLNDETISEFIFLESMAKMGCNVKSMRYDASTNTIYADGKIIQSEPLRFEIPNGLSYLHLQTVAEKNDFDGTYIKYLKAF